MIIAEKHWDQLIENAGQFDEGVLEPLETEAIFHLASLMRHTVPLRDGS
jgi:hypothetical protein